MQILLLPLCLLSYAAAGYAPAGYVPVEDYGGMDSYGPYIDGVDKLDLYKMQLLADAFGVDDYITQSNLPSNYWSGLEDVEGAMEARADGVTPDGAEAQSDDITADDAVPTNDADDSMIYNDQLYSGAHLRDEEHLEHSALHGYQSVSGGASEVPPNPKEVKSDKQLPEYCNPPNPCPVGKTGEDNCVEKFENTASNNLRLLSQQTCPCDSEHMFSCPRGGDTVSSKAGAEVTEGQGALDQVLQDLAGMGENSSELPGASKRTSIVVKKSPHMIRKRSEDQSHGNPYLQGESLAIAAKKDPNMAQRVIPQWAQDRH